jgi:hypothetical protein
LRERGQQTMLKDFLDEAGPDLLRLFSKQGVHPLLPSGLAFGNQFAGRVML